MLYYNTRNRSELGVSLMRETIGWSIFVDGVRVWFGLDGETALDEFQHRVGARRGELERVRAERERRR